MSVFDRAWFYKSTSDDFTNRISKYFDSFEKKEKQMFEESWNPIFGQSLKWTGTSRTSGTDFTTSNDQKLGDWQLWEEDSSKETVIPPSKLEPWKDWKMSFSQFNPETQKPDVITFDDIKNTKDTVDELKSQVKVLEENYNKLLDKITQENIPEMEAPKITIGKNGWILDENNNPKFCPVTKDFLAKLNDIANDAIKENRFDKNEGNIVTSTSSQEEDVKKLLDRMGEYMKKLCIGSELDTTSIQEDDETKYEAQLKDLNQKTLEETFPENPPDAISRTVNHKAYHTIEDMFDDIEEDLDKDSEDIKKLKDMDSSVKFYDIVIEDMGKEKDVTNEEIKNLKRKIVSDYLSSGKMDTVKLISETTYFREKTKPQDSSALKNSGGTTLSRKISDIVNKELEKFEKLPPIEISIPEGATLSCRTEPERDIKFTYHKNHEWISCENALPKEGVAVELKVKCEPYMKALLTPTNGKFFQFDKVQFTKNENGWSFWSKDGQNFFKADNKFSQWRPLPQDSLLDVLEIDENDPDYKEIKGMKDNIVMYQKHRQEIYDRYTKNIGISEENIAYLESKLKEKTLNPLLKKERETLYKTIKEKMELAKDMFYTPEDGFTDENISKLQSKLPKGIVIARMGETDYYSIPLESRLYAITTISAHSADGCGMILYYDPKHDKPDFKIGDQVIGLSPDNTVVMGTIENIQYDIQLTYDGAKGKCPVYLTITEKRPSDSWLDARRTIKLTPELKEEINKILA